MEEFCDCNEWRYVVDSYDLFIWEPTYGWVLKWTELTKEKGYSKAHRYGITVEFCPKCGKKLSGLED